MKIKEEFKNLIPALSVEEFKQLEENCLAEGIRDAIITWHGYIIDGHNRYEIATKHKLKFETESKEFDSEIDAKIWMVNNQLGRRNLQPFVKGELTEVLKELLIKKGKENMSLGGEKKEGLSIMDKPLETHNTQKIIADQLGWGVGTKARFDVVVKKAPEEVKAKLRTGEVSINQVYQDIKKEEKREQQEIKKQEYKHRIETVSKNEFKIDIFNTGKQFRIIYADPPWQYDLEQTSPNLGGAIKHYNSMSIKELCALPIKEITAKDCVLFLWVTSPKLNLFLELMESWGFEYKTSFVWDKVKHNMGHYNSVRHEFLLIGGKGKSTPDVKKLFDSVISIERSEKHSEKPVEFIDLIDSLYNFGDRIELFARQAKKNNWFYWGNEI
jgi:N6-adenosine-specific RNA methylase IME4